MTDYTQDPKHNWRQTVAEFREYLRQTVASLPLQQQADTDEVPVSLKARKARTYKQTKAMSGIRYQAQFVYLLPAGQQRPVSEPSTARRYSSPLWIMIGDNDRKQKQKTT